MHNNTKKKKARTRSRPKNKANQQGKTPIESAHATKSMENGIEVKEEKMSVTCPEINEAIKLIQKLLREKYLYKSTEQKPKTEQPPLKISNTEPHNDRKTVLLNALQKQVEHVILDKCFTSTDMPATKTLYANLEKIRSQPLVSDIETTDDEEHEYIEYVYKPRQYFLISLCNFCKTDLCQQQQQLPCTHCALTYYCCKEHMKNDQQHRQLCYAIRQVVERSGNDIFYKCGVFTPEQFRSYRIVCIKNVENELHRKLTAMEQEVLLFPRICNELKCREQRFQNLSTCLRCGEVAFCKTRAEHLNATHKYWCEAYCVFKALVQFQEKFGRLEPSLPSKILKEVPINCTETKQILSILGFDKMSDVCEYTALSQISTAPLTAWYALKLCVRLKDTSDLVIHLIGAELEFEIDVLHKWEIFLLHLIPNLQTLNVIFIGPELNPHNISLEQLKKTKCCRSCRKNGRIVNYYFENRFYHNYTINENLIKPNLVCFYNAGLHRTTGYGLEDTWPETIQAVANFKCPIVVTSYTKYEAPLDMRRLVQESNRKLNVVLPPIINPFASEKPERNFISDEESPLMFKNYYCFIVE